MLLEEVAKNPLTDRVIRSIQDLILRGAVTPGEYLPPQPQLAAQLGVGLSTVREAVKALSLIGLVEATPGRGTLVMPDALKILSSDAAMKANLAEVELTKVLEARMAIEAALTHMAAERATPEDIAEIEAQLMDMEAARGNNQAFTAPMCAFTWRWRGPARTTCWRKVTTSSTRCSKKAIEEADALPGGADRALVNHREILEGIRNRQPLLAQRAAQRQMDDVVGLLKDRKIIRTS